MLPSCQRDGCEIVKLCSELHRIGCGGDSSWLAVVLFARNLVRMFSVFSDVQKKMLQDTVIKALAEHDPSAVHLTQVVVALQEFIVHNTITNRLEEQLDTQLHDAAALGEAVTEFLRESFAGEQERRRVIDRFGEHSLELLDQCVEPGILVRELRTLITDMLHYYRDAALAWEGKAKELERLVSVDPLLAPLHNRRALDAHVEKAVQQSNDSGKPLSLFMIAVDNFKKTINDIYGHQVGDDVLRTLAKIVNSYAVANDWFAARYGGDELVLVCPIDVDQAQFFAEALRLAVQQYEFRPREAGKLIDPPIRFTVSIGVAAYCPGMTGSDLLAAADQAMYQVKGTGKNNVIRYCSS